MEALSDENAFINDSEQLKTDSRISYPCYKSFDEFIDVERLVALNDYIIERINLHIKAEKDDYFLNLHRLDETMPYQPGVREIWLTRNKPGTDYDYINLDETERWEKTEAADEFADLMDFIATLPFKETGRILIIYDNAGKEVPPHRDHLETETCNEFIWFRTNLTKPFYVLNHLNGEKKYVESYSAWFDAVNQFHGSERVEGLSFSIRVDGKFTDEFRAKIPRPETNAASTSALWACLETQKG
ncbi:MAG TPA: hypothetical protein VF721_10385 [Pyrinomonadaceae bacterium]